MKLRRSWKGKSIGWEWCKHSTNIWNFQKKLKYLFLCICVCMCKVHAYQVCVRVHTYHSGLVEVRDQTQESFFLLPCLRQSLTCQSNLHMPGFLAHIFYGGCLTLLSSAIEVLGLKTRVYLYIVPEFQHRSAGLSLKCFLFVCLFWVFCCCLLLCFFMQDLPEHSCFNFKSERIVEPSQRANENLP